MAVWRGMGGRAYGWGVGNDAGAGCIAIVQTRHVAAYLAVCIAIIMHWNSCIVPQTITILMRAHHHQLHIVLVYHRVGISCIFLLCSCA